LWKQLDLDIDSLDVTTGHPGSDEFTFLLGIRHCSGLQQENVKRLHRLNVGDSAADLKPPRDVDVLELERIHVTLNFKHEEGGNVVGKDGDNDMEIRHDEAGRLNNGKVHHDDEEMLDAPDSMMLELGELSPLLLDGDFVTSIDHEPSQTFEIAKATPSSIHPTKSISIPAAVDLLDAALRGLICAKPFKLPLGVWLPQSTHDQSLSLFAPSLFCPGHAKVKRLQRTSKDTTPN